MLFKISKREYCFSILYTIYLIVLILSQTAVSETNLGGSAFKYIRYICYFFAVIMILLDSYREKQIWSILVLAVLTAGTVVSSGNSSFILYLIMILAAKDVNVTLIAKCTCIIQGAILVIVISLSQMGIIPDYIFDATSRMRHGLGFLYTTTGAILYFYFMILYVYLRREKAHAIEYVILELINFWFYRQTDARMCFYLSSVMLVYAFVMRFFWQNRTDKIRKNKCLVLAPAFFCLLALGMQIAYNSDNSLLSKANEFLSGRLELGHNAWTEYGLSLLGTKIQWIGYGHNAPAGSYNFVDCSYMMILVENGIIPLIIIIAAYTYIMYVAIKEKDFYLQTALLVVLVLSITEPRLLDLAYNPFPFFAVASIGLKEKAKLFERKSYQTGRNVRWKTTYVRLKYRK